MMAVDLKAAAILSRKFKDKAFKGTKSQNFEYSDIILKDTIKLSTDKFLNNFIVISSVNVLLHIIQHIITLFYQYLQRN